MSAGKTNNIPLKSPFGLPAFIQLFMLLVQSIYLLVFFSDFLGFKMFVFMHFEAFFIFMCATSLISFVAYWFGFRGQAAKNRILFALLVLFHFAVAYCSFWQTAVNLISRC